MMKSRSNVSGDNNEMTARLAGDKKIITDSKTMSCREEVVSKTSAVKKPNKQRQKQQALGRRRHQELGSSTANKSGIMGGNRRRRLPQFIGPPHPAKLSSHQRRPRKSSSLTASLVAVGGGNHLHHQQQQQQQPLQQQAQQQSNQNNLIYICSGCQQPIKDRYLLSACDKYWHDDCLKCNRCQAKLGELGSSLYAAANMNLCRQDYYEMFGQKAICAVCDKLIYASEMVMRARENVYHLECFACQLCGLRFCVGDRFHLCENKIVCQYDYDEHIYPIQYQQQQEQQQQHLQLQHYQLQQQQYDLHFSMQAGASLESFGPMGNAVQEQTGANSALQHQTDGLELNPSVTMDEQQQQHEPELAQLDCNSGPVYHTMESSGECEANGGEHRAPTQDGQRVDCTTPTPLGADDIALNRLRDNHNEESEQPISVAGERPEVPNDGNVEGA